MGISVTNHTPLGIVKRERELRRSAIPYLGWRIFACRLNEDTKGESKRSLIDWIRQRFTGDEWLVENQDGGLIIEQVESEFDLTVKIEAIDLPIYYAMRAGEVKPEIETYLVLIESESLPMKIGEVKHKKLMEQVLRRLPWSWQKVGCYVGDGQTLTLTRSSNIERGFEPFQVEAQTWLKLPIPEAKPKSVRPRVVKYPPRKPKQRRKVNALKNLIEEVTKDKGQT